MAKTLMKMGRRVVRRGLPLFLGLSACGVDANEEEPTSLTARERDADLEALNPMEMEVEPPRAHLPTAELAPESVWDGHWLAEVDVPVRWPETTMVAGGRGVVRYTFSVQRSACSGRLCDTFRMCNVQTPPFGSKKVAFIFTLKEAEAHATSFDAGLFDGAGVPTVSARHAVSGYTVGSRVRSGMVAFTLGVHMPDPSTPWPRHARDLRNVVDMDEDGYPGVTLYTRKTDVYDRPAVNMTCSKRAHAYHIAARTLMRFDLTFTGWNEAEGTAYLPEENGALAIQTRILGCLLSDQENECSLGETSMADDYLIAYEFDGEARVRMRRTKPGQWSCRQVRAAALN